MTIRELQQAATQRVAKAYGGDQREAQAVTRLIFETLKGWRPVDMAVRGADEASDYLQQAVQRVVRHIEGGEPVQYALGTARFMGLDLKVTPAVLIPRPETQQLVDLILDRYADRPDLSVLDIGTGSGCIAIALARGLRFAAVTAIDVSTEALEIARQNGQQYKAKIAWQQADITTLQPVAQTYDIIVSNPPYIQPDEAAEMEARVLDHEPHTALFAPADDPLHYYRAIAAYAAVALKPGGRLYLEINPLTANGLKALLEQRGFVDIEILHDMYGRNRFAVAQLPL